METSVWLIWDELCEENPVVFFFFPTTAPTQPLEHYATKNNLFFFCQSMITQLILAQLEASLHWFYLLVRTILCSTCPHRTFVYADMTYSFMFVDYASSNGLRSSCMWDQKVVSTTMVVVVKSNQEMTKWYILCLHVIEATSKIMAINPLTPAVTNMQQTVLTQSTSRYIVLVTWKWS